MAKCYVIKNQEGEYDCGSSGWRKCLPRATIYEKGELFELYDIFHWQEITIAEGDLEKELEVYKRALELACEDLNLYEDITSTEIKTKCYLQDARKELEDKDD